MAIRVPRHADHYRSEATLGLFHDADLIGMNQSMFEQGMTCHQAAHVLGDAPRTVEYWVRAYSRVGLAGLQEGARPGRRRA